MEKIAVEFVAGVEDYPALAVFQVIDEAALVDVQSSLFQPSLSFVFLIFELALICLVLVGRSELSPDQFIILKISFIDCALLRKHSLSEGMITEPRSLMGRSIVPGELALTVLFIIFELSLVNIVILV